MSSSNLSDSNLSDESESITEAEQTDPSDSPMAQRFRGYLPVVIDIETGGFNAGTDAMLEIAACLPRIDDNGQFYTAETLAYHINPFEGSNIEDAAIQFTGIKLDHPLRPGQEEGAALKDLFQKVRVHMRETGCKRAILTGHNASFDLGFLNAAIARIGSKRNPFHPFSCFDTATLAGLAYGQTVLAKACIVAGIEFSNEEAHSAAYDAEKTSELFCKIVNQWQQLGGWPLPTSTSKQSGK